MRYIVVKVLKCVFVCNECGVDYLCWQGQCSVCYVWNIIIEVCFVVLLMVVCNECFSGYFGSVGVVKVQKFFDISFEELLCFFIGFKEFDCVLGGGVVSGSVILIGGNSGVGKFMLLL